MEEILSPYEIASGQAINMAKSEIFFSSNVEHGSMLSKTLSLSVFGSRCNFGCK